LNPGRRAQRSEHVFLRFIIRPDPPGCLPFIQEHRIGCSSACTRRKSPYRDLSSRPSQPRFNRYLLRVAALGWLSNSRGDRRRRTSTTGPHRPGRDVGTRVPVSGVRRAGGIWGALTASSSVKRSRPRVQRRGSSTRMFSAGLLTGRPTYVRFGDLPRPTMPFHRSLPSVVILFQALKLLFNGVLKRRSGGASDAIRPERINSGLKSTCRFK